MPLPSLALLPLAAAAFSVPASDSAVYRGRDSALKVAVPRVEEAELRIDGSLDEPAWRRAAVLTGFSQFQPADGRPAADSTEVLVWYGATAIHFGIRAFEAHGTVNATLADRDEIFADDHVQLLLSTFNDGRQAFMFAVNPFGVQADGTLNEGSSGRGGGFTGAGRAGREPADLSADFVFESKGRTTPGGYEVEVRIPFKSLRYQATDVQDWGIHVMRRVQHLGHEDSWVPATQAASSFLGQAGSLTGLRDLRRGLVLDLTPSVVWREVGSRRLAGDAWTYQPAGPEVGGTARWGITNNLTLNATVRPDFSQVEADVGAFTFDPRSGVRFPERRPFFLEGIENFQTPNSLVYTRAIVQPDAALKLTGKIAGTNVAVLSAVDDRAASFTGEDHPLFNVVRLVRDIGGQSRVGFIYTDKIDGERSNRVAGADALIRFRRIYSARLQAVGSRTDDADGAGALTAPLWRASLDRDGRRFTASYSVQGVDRDFRADAGFIERTGEVRAAATHRFTFYGDQGAKLESYALEVVTDGTWGYQRFLDGESVRDKKLHLNNNFALKGGWRLIASTLIETFGYDDALYRGYMVERTSIEGVTDTVPFTGTARIPNLDWVVSINTPDFRKWSANGFYLWGRDENFFEWASADIIVANFTVRVRPTDQLRLEAQYQHQEFNRRTDGSTVGIRKIPRLKAEYQIARPLFFRIVGQYDAFHRDSLRDESRTGFPLLVPTRTGGLARTTTITNSTFRADWLLSYQPNPGTVIFAGYGSSLTEDDPLRFRDLRRTSDGVFVKVSYLFRM